MFIDLPPNSPTQAPVVMVADASQTQKPATSIRTLGICVPMPNRPDDQSYLGEAGLNIADEAASYFFNFEKQTPFKGGNVKVTLLQPPAHGEISEIVDGFASCKPTRGFAGQDKIVALVELGGYQVKVVYFIKVQPEGTGLIPDDEEVIKKYCGPKGRMWKISTTFTTPAQGNAALQNLVNAVSIDSRITVDIADLTGNAIGQTTGTAITLDTTAAGNGWFVDSTPADNSEFLPTSNPNEWIAKAGTAAAGKMDMLSVLLHEYGHALGIDHSSNPNDFMATTLTAGVRRLPSAAEMALMQQLIAQAKTGVMTPQTGNNAATDQPNNTPLPIIPLGGFGTTMLDLTPWFPRTPWFHFSGN